MYGKKEEMTQSIQSNGRTTNDENKRLKSQVDCIEHKMPN